MVKASDINELLATAKQRCEQGALEQAEAICLDIVRAFPQHDQTMNQLGVIAYYQQKFNDAIYWWQKALATNPRSLITLINIGTFYYAQQHYHAALKSFNEALDLEPDSLVALTNKANTLLALNQFNQAIDAYQTLAAQYPDRIDLQSNKGLALFRNNQLEEAELVFADILDKQPDYFPALVNFSNVLLRLKKYEEYKGICLKIISINPNHIETLENRAILYLQLKQFSQALTDLEKVIAIDPNNIRAICNCALALSRLRRYEESLKLYDQALALSPNEPSIFMDKAAVLSHLTRNMEAVEHYKMALRLQPDNDTVAVMAMNEAQHTCDWRDFDKNIESLKKMIAKPAMQGSNLNVQGAMASFLSLILPDLSAAEQFQCAKKYSDTCFKDIPKITLKTNQHQTKSKLHIGYLSGDFRRHAVSQLLVEVLELHHRDEFTVIAFSYGVDDGSTLRKRVEKAVDQFIDLNNMDVVQAAKTIADMNIDVLVDLGGHTESGRPAILAQRPAPVQIEYLGYLGTTGADFIDYIIADHFLIKPSEEKYYAEKIIYLPSYQANDRQCEIASLPTRQACHLPEEAIVFCCFNVPQKITPIIFDVWCRLLSEVTGSVLWLFATGEESKSNLIKEAQIRGIDASRLHFAEIVDLPAHLARLQCADVFLDTLPYNAGATASNALWAGVPVVTCAGETFSSRMAGSLLTALGVPELITYNLQDYFQRALELATDAQKRQGIRQKILLNKTTAPLFDTPALTAHLEEAYKRVVSERV